MKADSQQTRATMARAVFSFARSRACCARGSSARSSPGVLYMVLLAGESVWQPHRLQKSGAGHLPAVPWKLERTKNRVILDAGARQAFFLNLGREALLRGAL